MPLPRKDALLVPWAANAAARLGASPETYHQTPAFAAEFAAVAQGYIDAYHALKQARESGTRSESQTATKDARRQLLLDVARPLYATVQAARIDDADKVLLGVHVRAARRRRSAPPGQSPMASVEAVDGHTVTLRLRDAASPDDKRRPAWARGAVIFSHVGDKPADASALKFEAITGDTRARVTFPASVTPGTRVWLAACWFDGAKRCGPVCDAVGAVVNYGGTMTMTTVAMAMAA